MRNRHRNQIQRSPTIPGDLSRSPTILLIKKRTFHPKFNYPIPCKNHKGLIYHHGDVKIASSRLSRDRGDADIVDIMPRLGLTAAPPARAKMPSSRPRMSNISGRIHRCLCLTTHYCTAVSTILTRRAIAPLSTFCAPAMRICLCPR